MAQFYKPTSKKIVKNQVDCKVFGIDLKAQGVAKVAGQVVFVPQALPDETVKIQITTLNKVAQGELQKVLIPSVYRVQPSCQHYQYCGGCQLQHLQSEKQIQYKQQALENLLNRKNLVPQKWFSPIASNGWRYRGKVRLALDVRGQIRLGFRQEETNKIFNLTQCPIMTAPLENLLKPLQKLIAKLDAKSSIGHVEILQHSQGVGIYLHKQEQWSGSDWQQIETWLEQNQVHWLDVEKPLNYLLPKFDLQLWHKRSNFIQSNMAVNEKMISQAIEWLELTGSEKVLDLFCGIGNFTLPLAKFCQHVTGVEGVPEMVEQATANAKINNIENVKFHHADLSARLDQQSWWQKVDAILLDPARAGAEQVVSELTFTKAKKVLYVSCNPATLVRDSEIMAKQGFQIAKAAVMDMFPQTHHLEAMFLFIKE